LFGSGLQQLDRILLSNCSYFLLKIVKVYNVNDIHHDKKTKVV
jgi:hypothetical protein